MNSAPDWSRLFHAYGPADDTPAHLAALSSDDPTAVHAAIDHLGSAILHQGTVWTATPPVVDQVAQFVAETQECLELAALVDWLRETISAASAIDVAPLPVPVPDSNELELFFAAAHNDDEDAWSMPAFDLLMKQAVVDVRALAPKVVMAVAPLLDHARKEVRRVATAALGSACSLMPTAERIPTVERLSALVDSSDDRDERAVGLLALGETGGDTSRWLDNPDPAIRCCAALSATGAAATSVLLDAMRNPMACDGWFVGSPPQLVHSMRFVVLLELLSRDVALADLVPAFTAMIELAGPFTVDFDIGPILQRTFPDVQFTPGSRPDPATDWTAAQCAVVAALVANDRIWDPSNGNANLARMRVGLPDDHDAVSALLARYR